MGLPGLDNHSQKLLARGRSFPNRGLPGIKRSGSTAGPGQVIPARGRPVRDQGGIKAGPRRDHFFFLHLILTDYQLLLFSCIVFRATGTRFISVI